METKHDCSKEWENMSVMSAAGVDICTQAALDKQIQEGCVHRKGLQQAAGSRQHQQAAGSSISSRQQAAAAAAAAAAASAACNRQKAAAAAGSSWTHQ